MPSCIVKNCRNNSMVCKKKSGITFHKFPTDINWKYKWIQVIRACRSEESWLPSQFSVVCSAHFADDDVYKTPGGNRRITKNAIPRLKLYDVVPKRKKCDHNMPVDCVTVSVQTTYAGESGGDDELPDSKMIADVRQETSRHSSDRLQSVIIKVEPTETTADDNTTREIETQTSDDAQNVIIKVEPNELASEEQQSVEISIDPLAPQPNDQNEMNIEEWSMTSYHQQELKKKDELLHVCRKKMRILRQKVNRLQSRNMKLKNILKEIRYKKLIDRDVFKKLTATLINNDD